MSPRRLAVLVLVLPLAACRAREGAPPLAIHLVDLHRPAETAAKAAGPAAAAPAVPLGDWKAGPGVVELAVRDGLLTGRTTTDFPLIHLEQPPEALRGDVLHSVEVRLKVSAGGNVGFAFRGGETLDLQQVLKFAGEFPWAMTSPLVPGPELQTLTLRPPRPEPASQLRHLLLRPTDAAGARFEIASVRIVSRREHLAGIPSGVSWQGLAQIYRETLVSRAPEALAFEVTPPPGAFLDVGLGTVEEGPVRFRVRAGDETLLERTVTTPHRWEPLAVDLARWAGRPVKLSLSVAAEKPGTLGLWGSPVVRGRRGAGADAANTSDVGPPQGVVLVWMDTLRRDHLGAYGYRRPTDPVLSRLAREGASTARPATPRSPTRRSSSPASSPTSTRASRRCTRTPRSPTCSRARPRASSSTASSPGSSATATCRSSPSSTSPTRTTRTSRSRPTTPSGPTRPSARSTPRSSRRCAPRGSPTRAMAKVLAGWRRAAVAARLAPDAAAAKGLAPEELERLRSLGYIQQRRIRGPARRRERGGGRRRPAARSGRGQS